MNMISIIGCTVFMIGIPALAMLISIFPFVMAKSVSDQMNDEGE